MRRLLSLALLACVACSSSLYSTTRWTAGQAAGGRALSPADRPGDKAAVLARFGAPAEVVALSGGDLFIYRLRRTDLRQWNVNSGLVSSAAVPLYLDVRGERVDQQLYVRFDERGRVVELSASAGR